MTVNHHKLKNMLHRVQSARNQVALGRPLAKKHYTQRLRLYRKACAAVGVTPDRKL
jgi:hypothetical protein